MKCIILDVKVVKNDFDETGRVVASVYATEGNADHFFEVGLLKITESLLWNIPNIGYIPKEAEEETFGITQYRTVVVSDEKMEMCDTEYEKYTTHTPYNVKAHVLTRVCTRTLNAFRRECLGTSNLAEVKFDATDKIAVLEAAKKAYRLDDWRDVRRRIYSEIIKIEECE
jgi:hypothetical protein